MGFLWWGKKKPQIYVVDNSGSVYKSKLIRLNNGKVLIRGNPSSSYSDKWMLGNINGTFERTTEGRWYYQCDHNYSADKVLDIILTKEELMLQLIGIDKDLDKVIAEKTKKDIQIN
jgi:hypothetical protein